MIGQLYCFEALSPVSTRSLTARDAFYCTSSPILWHYLGMRVRHHLAASGALALLIPMGTLALLTPIAALAHHAFAAEFQASNPVTITGTVSRVAWLNPHARFYVSVKEPRGVVQWELVLGSPNLLIRQGWEKDFLKQGDVVTILGFQARDGSHLAAARSIKLPSGKIARFGTAGDGGPER